MTALAQDVQLIHLPIALKMSPFSNVLAIDHSPTLALIQQCQKIGQLSQWFQWAHREQISVSWILGNIPSIQQELKETCYR